MFQGHHAHKSLLPMPQHVRAFKPIRPTMGTILGELPPTRALTIHDVAPLRSDFYQNADFAPPKPPSTCNALRLSICPESKKSLPYPLRTITCFPKQQRFRIDGDALFVENGFAFDGANGGAFSNFNGGTAMCDQQQCWRGVFVLHLGCPDRWFSPCGFDDVFNFSA